MVVAFPLTVEHNDFITQIPQKLTFELATTTEIHNQDDSKHFESFFFAWFFFD